MTTIAIIQARMGSRRFPGKVLENLRGKPILQWVLERTLKVSGVHDVVVATSTSECDDQIIKFCNTQHIKCFRGSETDVLSRFYYAAKEFKADIIIRVTADCPLIDPAIVDQALYLVSSGTADYASNILPPTWPDGLDCEVFTFFALEKAFKSASRESDREHVTPFIRNNQFLFKVRNIVSPDSCLHLHRWTIDTPEDLFYMEDILSRTKENLTTWDVLEAVQKYPEIKRATLKRNEGFEKSLEAEKVECSNFENSHNLLERALETIPLGSQTFSKSYIQYPQNTSPMFLTHGQGSHVWDADGNEYIDLVSGLLPVILGYNDPDVNQAIQNQLSKGISFSLSTELEIELAEKLCEIIPSAEKVRFAKNGTDVTSAAIRIARAYTGREKVIVCGYHGWQDWYIGSTTRNKGVPKSTSQLTTIIPYNDLEGAKELLKTKAYAGLILEPCNVTFPNNDYLSALKKLCEQNGTLLIFDEVITGFRFALGGAQEYFGVTPHLSCFGKAMGNGMPISAIVGQNEYMKEMEEIFFSGTFGGETLSLAASLATINKIECENVPSYLWSYGASLSEAVEKEIINNQLSDFVKLSGCAPWKILQFLDHPNATNHEVKTLFIQEMIKRGILINSSLNINFSHRELEKFKILKAFEEVLHLISVCLGNGTVKKLLQSPAIQPLFKVR